MTTVKTKFGVSIKIEQNGNVLRIKVMRITKDVLACIIKQNNDHIVNKTMSQYDKVSFYQFIDTCNVVINTFKRLTGYINDTALNDVVSAFADYLR